MWDNDHEWAFAGGPMTSPSNPGWWMAAIFVKC